MKPTFGVDRDPGVVASFLGIRRRAAALSSRPNPMVVAVGAYAGPELEDPRAGPGRTRPAVCGDCRFLYVKHDHGSRRYYGCEKRGARTQGPGTDHLVGWPACTAFEEG